MLVKSNAFTHRPSGAVVTQRRTGDRSYLARFTVTRTDGESRAFRHGGANYIAAIEYATAESVPKKHRGKDHPLMQAGGAKASAAD